MALIVRIGRDKVWEEKTPVRALERVRGHVDCVYDGTCTRAQLSRSTIYLYYHYYNRGESCTRVPSALHFSEGRGEVEGDGGSSIN